MTDEFRTEGYQKINQARLDHLASLGLKLEGKSVLELGAGVGDMTGFWLARDCKVTAIEGRHENAERIRATYPDVEVYEYDLEKGLPNRRRYDIVFAYGVLYHLACPEKALAHWIKACKGLLLLETCVKTKGTTTECREDPAGLTASLSGNGCRPSRGWLWKQLDKRLWVYVPKTQPDHGEFPLGWLVPHGAGLSRAVFVASRTPLALRTLSSHLLLRHSPTNSPTPHYA